MKRRALQVDNSVDGNELKKIKKLMFKLDGDSDNDQEERKTLKPSKQVHFTSKVSDDESDNSDSESEIVHDDKDDVKLNEEDLSALNKFLNPQTAVDVINEMKDAKDEVADNLGLDNALELDSEKAESLKTHIEELAHLMENYKKGRLFPKTVKVLPQTSEWYYLLEMTNFPKWSLAAVEYMTELFKAKGGEGVVIYYRKFLLPYVRNNIAEKSRLEDVLYKTLSGALFRRKEFMTGILLPWCNEKISGKEAGILGNILKHSTVKVDVAGPVLSVIMEQVPFSKEILIILNAFLEKKYNLPFQIIYKLIDYFYRAAVEDYSEFYTDSGKLPLLWFQTLNLFVSLYHPHFTEEGTGKLVKLCQVHVHDKITNNIIAYLNLAAKSDNKMVVN